jgi:RNA-directed DNA polymerase
VASGKKGVPQGGVISPLLSNIYLNDVDRMLERAQEKTRAGEQTRVVYARFADDLVILVDLSPQQDRLLQAVEKRLREELGKLQVELNEEKSRVVDLMKGESFGFLGFDFRLTRTRRGLWRPHVAPKAKKRTEVLGKLRQVFRSQVSQPVGNVIVRINSILRGWVNYFRIGDSYRSFKYIRMWTERRVRRHLMRQQNRSGFGWKRWSTAWLHQELGLFSEYRLNSYLPRLNALPDR